MRFLLYYPYHQEWPCKEKPLHLIKHGMAQIAGVLQAKGVEFVYVDGSIEQLSTEAVLDLVRANGIDHIGFSCFSYNLRDTLATLEAVRRELPGTVCIAGGPHATFYGQELLAAGMDMAVRGEAESIFMELVERGFDPRGVDGVTYLQDGQVVCNPDRERITDLDALPWIPYERIGFPDKVTGFLKLNEKNTQVTLMTSRGCRGRCIYCGNPYGRLIVNMSARRVVDEIEYLADTFGVNDVYFLDEDFANDEQRVRDICTMMMRRGLHERVIWVPLSMRVDVKDHSIFGLMKRAGCYRMGFGVESGSPRVLKKMGKKIDLDKVVRTVDAANRAGLVTTANFTVGHITETPEDIEMTSRFVNGLNVDYAHINHLVPVPGTRMWLYLQRHNLFNPEDYFDEKLFFYSMPKYNTMHMDYRTLNGLCRKVRRRYFLRPGYFLKMFRVYRKLRKVPTFSLWDSARYYLVSVVYALFKRGAVSEAAYKNPSAAPARDIAGETGK